MEHKFYAKIKRKHCRHLVYCASGTQCGPKLNTQLDSFALFEPLTISSVSLAATLRSEHKWGPWCSLLSDWHSWTSWQARDTFISQTCHLWCDWTVLHFALSKKKFTLPLWKLNIVTSPANTRSFSLNTLGQRHLYDNAQILVCTQNKRKSGREEKFRGTIH